MLKETISRQRSQIIHGKRQKRQSGNICNYLVLTIPPKHPSLAIVENKTLDSQDWALLCPKTVPLIPTLQINELWGADSRGGKGSTSSCTTPLGVQLLATKSCGCQKLRKIQKVMHLWKKNLLKKNLSSQRWHKDDLWIGKAPQHRLVKDRRVYQWNITLHLPCSSNLHWSLWDK